MSDYQYTTRTLPPGPHSCSTDSDVEMIRDGWRRVWADVNLTGVFAVYRRGALEGPSVTDKEAAKGDSRDDMIDTVEIAILDAIRDTGCFVNDHADELITNLAESVVDDPRSDWHDDEDEDDEPVCPACGERLDEDGREHHIVSMHDREFCSLECADKPREDWVKP